MKRLFGCAAVCGAVSVAAAQQAPVFRAGVELVTMRVAVVDEQGQPVRGLAAEDFSVRLEGQVRPVRVLTFLDLQQRAPAPIETRRETSNTAPGQQSTSGAGLSGRTLVLIIDDLSFRHTSSLLQVYRQELDRLLEQLGPTDRVALITTSGRMASAAPTADRAVTRSQLARLRGLFDLEDMRSMIYVSVREAEDVRSVWTWEQAKKMLEPQSGSSTWKDVWERECAVSRSLCEGPPPPPMFALLRATANSTLGFVEHQTQIQLRSLTDALRALSRVRESGEQLTLVVFSEGLGTRAARQSSALTRLSHVVAESGAAMYVFSGHADDVNVAETVGARRSSRYDEQRERMEGLEDLAGATGATLFRPVGAIGPWLTRILSETSGVYELAVEVPPSIRKRALTAQVTVNRKGAVVRMSRHAVSLVEPPPVVAVDEELATLVTAGGGAWSVPMTVGTSLRRDTSRGGLQLGVNLVIDDVARPPFRVRFAVVDAAGRVVNSGRTDSATHTTAFAIEMPAGPHRLRVAVADSTDAIGAVEHPVVGRLTRVGRFFSSDLQLASVDAKGTGRLLVIERLPPDAVRLALRLELYAPDVTDASGVVVRLDIGPAGAAPVASAVLPFRVEGAALVLSAQVPLEGLAAGPHLITARVMDGDQEVGRLMSTIVRAAVR